MEQKGDILWRIRLLYFVMAVFALLIIGKVAYIQLAEGDYWREQARTTTMRYVNIEAARGDICADDGRLLATSMPIYEIRMDLSTQVSSDELFYGKVDSLSAGLSQLFGDRSAARYRASLVAARDRQERYYLVKRHVSWHQLKELRELPLFRRGRFGGGLIVAEQTRREMPYQNLAARTIGYEREGIYVGLEGAYREYLEGQHGKRLMQRLSGGAWMPINDQNEIHPRNGMDLITTINIEIQDITEKALLRQLQRYNATHGTAVVMEVHTGDVKAISNLQRSDSGNTYHEVYNYAVGQSTEPGSTFKLPALMAAMEDGLVSSADLVNTGDGSIAYYDRTMHDALEGGHGIITVREAFALSSNTGISRIIYEGYNNNPGQFLDRLQQMKLNQPLGLEIAGEGKPFLNEPGQPGWSRVSLPFMAIGYEVSLTPLQILTFYNAVANNGQMIKPRFAREIRQAGRTVKRFPPVFLNRSIASPGTINMAQEMLIEVVSSGTASNINTGAYQIAGKTGTAQIAQLSQGYQSDSGVRYQASFVGYFPANNPVYSCIVVISNPRGLVFTGNQVAAPAFREIADKLYTAQLFRSAPPASQPLRASLPTFRNGHLQDMKTIYTAYNTNIQDYNKNAYWGGARIQADTISFREREFIENLVPEVVGMGLRDAIYVLENAGLRVRFSGRGTVQRQSIRPGIRIIPDNIIYIELS